MLYFTQYSNKSIYVNKLPKTVTFKFVQNIQTFTFYELFSSYTSVIFLSVFPCNHYHILTKKTDNSESPLALSR